MPRFCSAYGCVNRSDKRICREKKVGYHRFPLKNEDLLKRWIINVRRKDFVPNEHSLLCSEHFEPECFELQPFTNIRRIKSDAIPTIFSFKPLPQKKRKAPYIVGISSCSSVSDSSSFIKPQFTTVATQTEPTDYDALLADLDIVQKENHELKQLLLKREMFPGF